MTEPTTEAGQRLHRRIHHEPDVCDSLVDILAIETEAAAAPLAALRVEVEAIHIGGGYVNAAWVRDEVLKAIARATEADAGEESRE